MAEASSHRPDYERSDVDPRLVAALACAAAVFLIGAPYLLLGVYPVARREPVPPAAAQPPVPRLQIDPRDDLAMLRADEHARLSTYGWIDQTHGIVRVPIERAIELTAQRGLPGWQKQ
jgi:hypothetical protein